MLRIHFTADDLTRIKLLAHPDPLWEMIFTGFRVREKNRSVIYRPWMRQLGASASHSSRLRAGSALLGTLAPLGPYFPDFLTPSEGMRGLDTGLEALLRTPRRQLRDQLERLARITRLPDWVRPLADGDRHAVEWLGSMLRGYHEVAIAPHSALIHDGIAADHAHRVQSLLDGGLDGLFASMHHIMRWRPPVLEVDYDVDKELHLRGRGLCLIPSYFCERTPVSLADPELSPIVVYPIAQEFKWPHAKRSGSPQPLEPLIGKTRSAILRVIDAGSSTTQIARRLEISLASVSRHTTVLRDAGFISSRRHNTAVLHSLTTLGTAVLEHDRLDR